MRGLKRFYVQSEQGELGPFYIDELEELTLGGSLKPSDKVRSQNETEWVPIHSIIQVPRGFCWHLR
jgi:hypothetical protein